MSPELSISRLQALASRLGLGVADFNIRHWDSCALGVAARMPEFNLAGLKTGEYDSPLFECHGFRRTGYYAAATFFGINDETTVNLFYPNSYFLGGRFTKPKTVAKRIEREIKRLRKELADDSIPVLFGEKHVEDNFACFS